MEYVILQMKKIKGSDTGTTAHIERTIHPGNADATRTHLNRELVTFPEGVTNRTMAISHRIATAGIKRKIGTNQVRAIGVVLSGSPTRMAEVEAEGQLDAWCEDNLAWLRDTFGDLNLVSAVLHRDEKTPHIHATIVPIVQGERRKAKQDTPDGKKKYRKKDPQGPRLCADEVLTRTKLTHYHDTYALAMAKYGLHRGVEGSKAKHISTAQYYRELSKQNSDLQQEVNDVQEKLNQLKGKGVEAMKIMDAELAAKLKDMQLYETKVEQLKQVKAKINEANVKAVLKSCYKYVIHIYMCMLQIRLPKDYREKLWNNEEVPPFTGTLKNPVTQEDVKVQNVAIAIDVSEQNHIDLCLNKLSVKAFFARLLHKKAQLPTTANRQGNTPRPR